MNSRCRVLLFCEAGSYVVIWGPKANPLIGALDILVLH